MSKKCTPLWREAHFQVKMHKAPSFGALLEVRWDVEKMRAIAAPSKFPSQNVQNTSDSDHFWTFRCRSAWQAQGLVQLVKNEENVRVL